MCCNHSTFTSNGIVSASFFSDNFIPIFSCFFQNWLIKVFQPHGNVIVIWYVNNTVLVWVNDHGLKCDEIMDKVDATIISDDRFHLKALMPITFSSPRAQLEVIFLVSHKNPYCLIITSNFQFQIHYSLEVTAENVRISDIPILIFLVMLTTASPLVSHTCLCPWKENNK